MPQLFRQLIAIRRGARVQQLDVFERERRLVGLAANGVQIANRGARITFVNGVSVNFMPPKDDAAAAAAKPEAEETPAEG